MKPLSRILKCGPGFYWHRLERLLVFHSEFETESLVHGLPLGVTVQRRSCTFMQVDWTYRVPSARSGLLSSKCGLGQCRHRPKHCSFASGGRSTTCVRAAPLSASAMARARLESRHSSGASKPGRPGQFKPTRSRICA